MILDFGSFKMVRISFLTKAKILKKEFTICLKNTDEPIGRIYISSINDHYDSLDISRIYVADPNNRGKGYGEEALRLALKWAFEKMNVERVTLDHFSDNVIANSLYKKVGLNNNSIYGKLCTSYFLHKNI